MSTGCRMRTTPDGSMMASTVTCDRAMDTLRDTATVAGPFARCMRLLGRPTLEESHEVVVRINDGELSGAPRRILERTVAV